jgi:hypothetical protein
LLSVLAEAMHRGRFMVKPISREAFLDRRQPLMRWSAVFAGTVLGIGVWILLQTLGMGLGLSAIDTDDAGSLKGVGIGTGIWSIIAPLIAMFVGAFVVGRLANTRDLGVAAMHGAVTWGLAVAIGLWLMLSIVSAMASGVARIGGAAANATGAIAGGAASAGGGADNAIEALGIDTSDLIAPINERLQRQGKPPITARQLNATVRAIAQRGVREGQLDRQVLVEELARNTALTRADAEDIANQFGDRYEDLANRVGTRVDQVGERAKHAALEAGDKTGKALLAGGIMMLLSLASAIGGSILGARRVMRGPREPTTATVVTPNPVVYPPTES